MANTTFLSKSELDFDTLKAQLKTFLKTQDIFKDYDFEGSNISVLLDLLTHNTVHNMFYLNMVGSEMFLDTATLRQSVVSHSKELNYVPRSRVSAKATVSVQITPNPGETPSTITLPKYYTFSSSYGDKKVLFTTDQTYVIPNNGNTYIANVDIYEGAITNEYFIANSSARYVVSSANVDISSLEVNVQNSNTDTSNANFSRAYTLYGLDGTSNVFFVQGYKENQYEIIFGNGVTGRQLGDGSVVRVTYRDSFGADGNGLRRFAAVSGVLAPSGNTYNNVIATTLSYATGGAEREDINSIKFNAPRHFAAQDRAITQNDFEILIRNNFPTIQAISVFGGEKLAEKKYGRVVIATKPYGGERTPQTVKDLMYAFLKERTSVSIDPIFVDPEYFYVQIVSKVVFDTSLTTSTSSDIEDKVRTAIDSYNTNQLFNFGNDFRYSKLVAAIDEADGSIVSNDTEVRMVKRISPAYGSEQTFTFKFNQPLFSEGVRYQIPAGHETEIESDLFYFLHSDGQTYQAKYVDDGIGNINLITGNSIQDVVLVQGAGSVDYNTGAVTIKNILSVDTRDHINIYARLQSKDIIVAESQILIIDQADVTVTVNQV